MRTAVAFLAATVVATTAACSLHPEDDPLEPESSVALTVAEHRITVAAHDAVTYAVGPEVVLEDLDGNGNPLTITCSRFSKAPPGSPVSRQYAYRVRAVDPERVPAYLHRFADYLRAHGWHRQDAMPAGYVAFARRSYSMSMSWAPRTGLLALGYSTGCLRRG